MKKYILLIISALLLNINVLFAETVDTAYVKVKALEKELVGVKSQLNSLRKENSNLKLKIGEIDKQILELNGAQSTLSNNLKEETSKLGQDINAKSIELKSNSDAIAKGVNNRTLIGGILLLLFGVGAFAIYAALHKRLVNGTENINKIKEAQDSLNKAQASLQEESVKLDNKLIELLEKQISISKEEINSKQSDTKVEVDHSLAIKVADEIARIELNLSRMDPSVRGFKQLSKAVERIKNNYIAKGYEIETYMGKTYNEGMNVLADFTPDDSLKPGERIVTGVTKPQIKYNGKLIQAAQIKVSQNI